MLKNLFVLVSLIVSSSAFCASTQCHDTYFKDVAPEIINSALNHHLTELCNTAYGTMYSADTRTPLWSADHLTRQHIYDGKGLKRVDSFRPDERLPASDRSELADYAHSGYDRGHVVPNADAYDEATQYDTFLLSNMMPQIHANNAGIWAGEESAARMLAKSLGEIYVVSGPLFIGDHIEKIHGRVSVPTHLFKAIYDPASGEAAAYLNTNNDSQDYQVMSIDELTKFSGIDPFPFLKGDARTHAMKLPKPIAPHFKDAGSGANNDESVEKEMEAAWRAVKKIFH